MSYKYKLASWLLKEYQYNTTEGLELTHDVGQTVNIIKKKYPEWHFKYNKGDTKFFIEIDNPSFDLDEFLSLLNNMGWFISIYSYEGDSLSRKNVGYNRNTLSTVLDKVKIKKLTFNCEASFDVELPKNPDILYHLAPLNVWHRIQQQGITPRSGSKRSYHPERVYLGISVESVEKLAPKVAISKWDTGYIILKIYAENLPHLRLFKDPNYTQGYYTLNTIPPSDIFPVKEIKVKPWFE